MRKFAACLALALGALLLMGCTAAPEAEAPAAASTPMSAPVTPSPTPTPAEMPAWAQEMWWLIYPDGMRCSGTEGCPNDYVSMFGEPGAVLPDNVEYYDPAKHDCTVVHPADMECFGRQGMPGEDCVHRPLGSIDFPGYAHNVNPDVTVPEFVGSLSDTGPREFATGEPNVNEKGRIVSYTVQPGDAVHGIAERFCIDAHSFEAFNDKSGQVLHPGEVLVIRPGSE